LVTPFVAFGSRAGSLVLSSCGALRQQSCRFERCTLPNRRTPAGSPVARSSSTSAIELLLIQPRIIAGTVRSKVDRAVAGPLQLRRSCTRQPSGVFCAHLRALQAGRRSTYITRKQQSRASCGLPVNSGPGQASSESFARGVLQRRPRTRPLQGSPPELQPICCDHTALPVIRPFLVPFCIVSPGVIHSSIRRCAPRHSSSAESRGPLLAFRRPFPHATAQRFDGAVCTR
jgi:hypothetical protein